MPEWLDADRLAQVGIGAIVVLLVGAVIVAKVVKTIVTKLIYLAIIGVFVAVVYTQRDELKSCQATCSCSLFGQDVTVPDSRVCGIDAISLNPTSLNPGDLVDLVLDRLP